MNRKKVKHSRQMRKSKQPSLYANINWQKAVVLFQRPLISSERNHKYPSTKEILHLLGKLAEAGMIIMSHGAEPGVERVLLGEQSYESWRTRKIVNQLAKQKYVNLMENSDGSMTVRITKHGLTRALTYELDTMTVVQPKRWDKKWRLVIFDIPDKYKRMRDIFRMRLRQLGLFAFQESAYISPYTCFNEVEFLRELYGVTFTVQYLLVEKVEDDASLRKHFLL